MKTHKEQYPEQYTHRLVGKRVKNQDGEVLTIERVVGSRFGQLAVSKENGAKTAFSVAGLEEVVDD